MDSLTHIVLGAAIGEAILGRQIGRKAALIGALAKTIPDFDILYTGLDDPLKYICHHRGHTHSLIWETLYAFPLAYIFYRIFKREISFQKWIMLFLICLYGHSILDVCTNYGTRLFLPFTNHAFAWNNIAIADIFYTLPMLVMLIVALCYSRTNPRRRQWIGALFAYCFLYIGYTFANKIYINHLYAQSIETENIPATRWMTNPTILTNFHWYALAANDSSIYVSETSVLFPPTKMTWTPYPRHRNLLNEYPDNNLVSTLKWFSNGYDITDTLGDTTMVYCVKFGRTNRRTSNPYESFVFHYKLFYDHGQSRMIFVEPDKGMDYPKALRDIYSGILGKTI